MRLRRAAYLFASVPMLLAACRYVDSFSDCRITCSTTSGCPDGLSCSVAESLCRTGETTTSCATLLDGGADCSAFGDWAPPAAIAGAGQGPWLDTDNLTLYFASSGDLFVSTRATEGMPFGSPTALAAENSTANEEGPVTSADGLTLYFVSPRGGSVDQLFRATRADRASAFGLPSVVPELSSLGIYSPWISADGTELYYEDEAAQQIAHAQFVGGAFQVVGTLTELAVGTRQRYPSLSSDGLTIFFDALVNSVDEIYTASRATPSAGFETPRPVPSLQLPAGSQDPKLSRDGSTIVFGETNANLYSSTRMCQ